MRIQCDSCESALAVVVCSADEAALCLQCDARIHAANKLAIKHQRVPLVSGTSKLPLCDICQEKTAFIFCLEDRALLCRNCDLPLHAPNTLASSHQRFLATGIRVAVSDACGQDAFKMEATPREPCKQPLRAKVGVSSAVTAPPVPLLGGLAGAATNPDMSADEKQSGYAGKRKNNTHCLPLESAAWRVDEVLNLPDLAGGYNLGDVVSSKADIPSLGGEFDWIADLSLFDEHIYSESFAEVPQLPSTPATTGWPRSGRSHVAVKGQVKDNIDFDSDVEDAFVVPDLGLQSDQLPSPPHKRRRNFIDI